jgi:hypothetical protein
MRFYSEKIIRSYSASRINLARSAPKPSLDMYSSEAFFFFFLGSEAHFGFLLQGLVQPRPSSDCFREAFEPILSIGCIRRGFLWTSKTVFWALPNQWTLALRCAFRKSPSELYKITVLCLLVLLPEGASCFYFIQLYHRLEVLLRVVDILFFGCR